MGFVAVTVGFAALGGYLGRDLSGHRRRRQGFFSLTGSMGTGVDLFTGTEQVFQVPCAVPHHHDSLPAYLTPILAQRIRPQFDHWYW